VKGGAKLSLPHSVSPEREDIDKGLFDFSLNLPVYIYSCVYTYVFDLIVNVHNERLKDWEGQLNTLDYYYVFKPVSLKETLYKNSATEKIIKEKKI
jgi:hypothetical protein